MRLEQVSRLQVAGDGLSMCELDIEALEVVWSEVRIEAEGIIASARDVGAVGIEQIHESKHGLRTVAPNPVLLAEVGAGPDVNAVDIGFIGRILIPEKHAHVPIKESAVDDAPQVTGSYSRRFSTQCGLVPFSVVKVLPFAGRHFVADGAAGGTRVPTVAATRSEFPAFVGEDVEVSAALIYIESEIGDAVAGTGAGELKEIVSVVISFRGDDVTFVTPCPSFIGAGRESDLARKRVGAANAIVLDVHRRI